MEWMLLGAGLTGLTVGLGAGTIAMGWFTSGKIAGLREELEDEKCFTTSLYEVNHEVIAEVVQLRNWKASVLSGLNKASAARKSTRLEKQAQERLIKQARTAELRRLVGEII